MFFFVAAAGCNSRSDVKVVLKDHLVNYSASNSSVYQLISSELWDSLFPHRIKPDTFFRHPALKVSEDFYSLKNFAVAASVFPAFLHTGTETVRKRELAAFLSCIAQLTSGGWEDAPDGYYKWGLYFRQNQDSIPKHLSIKNDLMLSGYPGKYYFGRGAAQLTWSYNYAQFSSAWYGDKDSLLLFPERLSYDPIMSFASAIWFWMTAQGAKPSCHAIMTEGWLPIAEQRQKGILPGYVSVVNVFTGGINCDVTNSSQKKMFGYYHRFCEIFFIPPGDISECQTQAAF